MESTPTADFDRACARAAHFGADLIILDELGFTPLNRVVADHLFRIVSERYERGSMIVTSSKPFEQWAEMFVEPILANAALDRLIHHAHVVPIARERYRMKDRRPPQVLGERPLGPPKRPHEWG